MTNPYETSRLLSEYLLLHYGKPDDILMYPFGPRDALEFPARCVAELVAPHGGGERALDLGCAVGRSSFELSRHYRSVTGIDFSASFIAAADRMREYGAADVDRVDEGEQTTRVRVTIPAGVALCNVLFRTGDAMALPEDIGSFDCVAAFNLLCRLPDPERCIARFPELVHPGGLLALATPWTWLEEFTPKAKWLGGGGQSGFEALRRLLEPYFELVERRDLPFLIREHARKFQWSVADGTAWRRLNVF